MLLLGGIILRIFPVGCQQIGVWTWWECCHILADSTASLDDWSISTVLAKPSIRLFEYCTVRTWLQVCRVDKAHLSFLHYFPRQDVALISWHRSRCLSSSPAHVIPTTILNLKINSRWPLAIRQDLIIIREPSRLARSLPTWRESKIKQRRPFLFSLLKLFVRVT